MFHCKRRAFSGRNQPRLLALVFALFPARVHRVLLLRVKTSASSISNIWVRRISRFGVSHGSYAINRG